MHPLTYTLAPILIPQALWVAARAARLPEATGARSGTLGAGPPLRLLILGDSSAAGVGVRQQSDALGGQLSQAMAARFTVSWRVLAKSGGTLRSTQHLLDRHPAEKYDAVLVALGVNDAKNGVSVKNWTQRYQHLRDHLLDERGAQVVCVTGLPPVQDFPVLPAPLNRVLGARFALFDAHLRQIAAERPGTVHLPFEGPLDVSTMAPDGFHPGPAIYREWALRAARQFENAGL